MPETVYFYHLHAPFGEFSNFARFPVEIGGHDWPTSEHYFQAQKFPGTPHEWEIRRAKTPRLAAEMGRDRSRPLRPDWEAAKDNVMREAVRAKFRQNPALRDLLLSTGCAELVEHTANDRYWGDGGDGGDGTGRNMLGIILMEVRAELRAADESGGRPMSAIKWRLGEGRVGRPHHPDERVHSHARLLKRLPPRKSGPLRGGGRAKQRSY